MKIIKTKEESSLQNPLQRESLLDASVKIKFKYRPMAGKTEDEVREEVERRKEGKGILRRRIDIRSSVEDVSELSLSRNRANSHISFRKKCN